MVTKQDYSANAVEAARSVLIEIVHILGAYHDDIVIVGGWVPELLLSGSHEPHIGSTDIDLALDNHSLQEPRYQPLKRLLLDRGYLEDEQQPFIFYRTVAIRDRKLVVQIDLLAGEYQGTGPSHRTQHFEDARARKARGCGLALRMNTEISIQGTLPDGGKDQVVVRVATIVPFLVMKGMALADRIKEKDAWDIYYCLKNYPGGLDAFVDEFMPHRDDGLVKEGLLKIGAKFASPSHVGPKWVAEFYAITDREERERVQRDAYEQVSYLLEKLGLK